MNDQGTDGADPELVATVAILSFFGASVGGVTGFGTALVFFSLWRSVQILSWLDLGADFERADPVLSLVVMVLAVFITGRSWKEAYPNLVVGLVPGLALVPWLVKGAIVLGADEESSHPGALMVAIGLLLVGYTLVRALFLRREARSGPEKSLENALEPRHKWEEQTVCSYMCPERHPEPEPTLPKRMSSHTNPNLFISYSSARLFWGQIPPNEVKSHPELSGRVAASIPTLLRSCPITAAWLCALPYSGIFWGALLAGAAAGALGRAHGTADTAILVYITMLPLSKQQLRASFVVALCLTQPVQIASLATDGMFRQDDWVMYVAAPACGLIGVLLGDWIHHYVNKAFTTTVSLVLVLAASVAFLSPMSLDTTYGVVAVALYILLATVLLGLFMWDQLTGDCWQQLTCLEKVKDPLQPVASIPLSLASFVSMQPPLKSPTSNLSAQRLVKDRAALSGEYGAVDSSTSRSLPSRHSSAPKPARQVMSARRAPSKSTYFRGIPHVSRAMRDTARDTQFRSAGSVDSDTE